MALVNIERTDPFRQPLMWFAGAAGLMLFALLYFVPLYVEEADPDPARLAFSGSTSKPLDWVETCLGKDWGGRLSLRHRANPKGPSPAVRLDNPVRHFVVDVVDTGQARVLRAYSQSGEPFGEREIEALDGCLTGAAFALADPRRS